MTDIDDETLRTLIEAAGNWHNELETYVVPSAQETSEEDAQRYRDSSTAIDTALTTARAVLQNDIAPDSEQRFNALKDRLIATTGSPGLTSFHGDKVHMTLGEWDRLITIIATAIDTWATAETQARERKRRSN